MDAAAVPERRGRRGRVVLACVAGGVLVVAVLIAWLRPFWRSPEEKARDYARYIAMLRSDKLEDVKPACEAIFASGLEIVPFLLDQAEDKTLTTFSPPLYPGAGLYPVKPKYTVGEFCLYLVESIRCGELAHSLVTTFTYGGSAREVGRAAAEYRKWYASVQGPSGTPVYAPAVDWLSVGRRARESDAETGGRQPQARYFAVPDWNVEP